MSAILDVDVAIPDAATAPDNSDDDDALLPPLSEIWDCTRIERFQTGNNLEKKWRCTWCPEGANSTKSNSGWNATKALWHAAKISGKDIRPCIGRIEPRYAQRYKDLYERKINSKNDKEGNFCACANLL